MRKVKCWIVFHLNSKFLVCNEPIQDDDYVYALCHGSYGKKSMYKEDGLIRKIVACDILECRSNIPFLPEYVTEAYEKGVREFYIELREHTITVEEPLYNQGLLKVTYNQHKRETFTRVEVLNMLTTISFLTFDAKKWLDNNYK